MTPEENKTVEANDRTVSYIPPQVVDYGNAADLTKTLAATNGNDGGSTPPNVYTS
jgi:hypothetical protein